MAASAASTSIPSPVFGTMERDDTKPSTYNAVLSALEAGYRRFDLAERYKTAHEVGRAFQESKIPRDELFIISKIDGLPCGDYGSVKARVDSMLQALPGVQRFDLLLIHHPLASGADLSADPSELVGDSAWNFFQDNIGEAWENMARLKYDGLAREIGVSNFYTQHLQVLDKAIEAKKSAAATNEASAGEVTFSESPPVAAVQTFIDCTHPDDSYVGVCHHRSPPAAVLAYRPLAFLPVLSFLESPQEQGSEEKSSSNKTLLDVLEEKARGIGCTDARQLVLAWLCCRGISPVVSSFDKGRIASNFAAAELATTPAFREAFEAGDLIPAFVLEQAEMLAMMGGADEYASAFSKMGLGN